MDSGYTRRYGDVPRRPDGEPDLAALAHQLDARLSPLVSGEDPTVVADGTVRVLARLPWGGLARVYLARSGSGEYLVAKLLRTRPEPADAARLQAEAANARRVEGPLVAAMRGWFPGPEPCLLQEFVVGTRLKDVIDDAAGIMRRGEAIGVVAGLLHAIAAAHKADVTHRDLTPSNVILAPGRGPVLIDFGIAQYVGDARLTARQEAIGTQEYMSPERIAGDRSGPSADVFAWGVIAALVLGGRHPFGHDGSHIDSVAYRRTMRDAAPDLSDIPQELRRLVASALDFTPERRPTAPELLGRLDRVNRRWAGEDVEPTRSTREVGPLGKLGRDLPRFLDALRVIRADSAARSEQDHRELTKAASGLSDRVAVRLYYTTVSASLLTRVAWIPVVLVVLVAGLFLGYYVPVVLEVLWRSLI